MSNQITAKRRATITGVGHYLPEKVVTNRDMEKLVDTTDEWIRSRTGIEERRFLDNGATSDLAAGAIKDLLRKRNISAEELDVIIVATISPDMFFPSTACIVQQKIGAKKAWGFDLSGACSGFLFALVTGAQFVETGAFNKVLVVGADKMSSITDFKDRNTCVLFGDGGAAVLIEPATNPADGILDFRLYCDGSGKDHLYMEAGGSLFPATHETVEKRMHYLQQDGKAVFKVAVMGMANVSAEILERNNLTGNDIDWLVPHQANLRIIDACAERMGLDRSKVMVNITKYGNTTAATIPLCLSEWWMNGRLRKGQTIVLSSFGAGYTWGAVLLRWSLESPSPANS